MPYACGMNRYALSAGLVILVCLAQVGCGTNSSHSGSAQPTSDSGAPGADSGLPDATMPPDDSGAMMMLGGGDAIAPTETRLRRSTSSRPRCRQSPSRSVRPCHPPSCSRRPRVERASLWPGASTTATSRTDRRWAILLRKLPAYRDDRRARGRHAGANGSQTIQRQVFVQLTGQQNGVNANNVGESGRLPTTVGQLRQAAASAAWGRGARRPPSPMPDARALTNPCSNGQAQRLALLYPYNKTVWPRGMLAPLLMWTLGHERRGRDRRSSCRRRAARSLAGVFGRPAILSQTRGPTSAPHPAGRVDMATNTAGGTDAERDAGPAHRRAHDRARPAWATGRSRRRGPSRPRCLTGPSTTTRTARSRQELDLD